MSFRGTLQGGRNKALEWRSCRLAGSVRLVWGLHCRGDDPLAGVAGQNAREEELSLTVERGLRRSKPLADSVVAGKDTGIRAKPARGMAGSRRRATGPRSSVHWKGSRGTGSWGITGQELLAGGCRLPPRGAMKLSIVLPSPRRNPALRRNEKVARQDGRCGAHLPAETGPCLARGSHLSFPGRVGPLKPPFALGLCALVVHARLAFWTQGSVRDEFTATVDQPGLRGWGTALRAHGRSRSTRSSRPRQARDRPAAYAGSCRQGDGDSGDRDVGRERARLMAQMPVAQVKPTSSRAMAVIVCWMFFPRPRGFVSLRYRRCCARQAISCTSFEAGSWRFRIASFFRGGKR